MSLIVYECQRADHVHEIRQFGMTAQSLYDYFEGRDEVALFVANFNIASVNLDGLIVKNDAIIIVEFKDYEGKLTARQNGDWLCNGKVIKGGSNGKTVFEQLRRNRRELRAAIAENNYFTEAQRSDIKGLVVLTKLESCEDDFDRKNKAWVFISDVENVGHIMHDITSAAFRTNKYQEEIVWDIPKESIFDFLRKLKIDESALVTDFTDTSVLPPDLYSEKNAHNGKRYSTATKLAEKTKEADTLREEKKKAVVTDRETQCRASERDQRKRAPN